MKTDIVIIGAGPIGIFTAFQAGMLNMSCHIVDVLDQAGGQCIALYPEKPIYDIPGYHIITGRELIEKLVEQAAPFKPIYHFNQKVKNIIVNADNIIVATNKETEIECKAIIIAAGNGIFEPKKPPLKNISEYENKSIFYSISKISQFQDKIITIAGGGDSAIDWAIELTKVAKKINIIHRRKDFRCAPETKNKLQLLSDSGLLEIVVPYQLHKLVGNDGILDVLLVKNIVSGEEKQLQTEYLLPFFGLSTNLGPINNWDIEIKHGRIVVNSGTLRTSRERIYAIGDIATYPCKLKLILNGFAESSMACYDIYKIIYPNLPLNFQYSTTKGVDF
ncbi:NAD(P)/FAD-dependent oxidoreductase [Wolbachia endosymbiont of Pentidionis agamae]|uniref:NAD(P)/FAD-dependent oxidoreductase n=1 Tax=Wolbachia endosymbiont of Pentidionis agamae TaxID=3110435 RepID=UPI002FD25A4B